MDRTRHIKPNVIPALALVLISISMMASCDKATLTSDNLVPTYKVKEELFQRHITAEGNLKATKSIPLSVPQNARGLKVEWLAKEGTQVKKDDVVIRFDKASLEEKLKANTIDLKKTLSKERREKLGELKNKSERRLSEEIDQKELSMATKKLLKDNDIYSRNQIIESQINSNLAEGKIDHSEATRAIHSKVHHKNVDLVSIERKEAERKIKEVKDAMSETELKAPEDGVFALVKGWSGNTTSVGQEVWPGQKLAELPLTASLESEVYVLEADAGEIAIDTKVVLRVEAHPDEKIDGKVSKIAALAEPRQQGVPIQYFKVTVSLDHTDVGFMKNGQRVSAIIELDKTQGIVIPRQAVHQKDGKNMVYACVNNDCKAREVELGASSPGKILVLNGLTVGESVALIDPNKPADDGKDKEDHVEDQ